MQHYFSPAALMLPASFTPQLLKRLENLRLTGRRNFLGSRQGGHLSLKRGHGLEFSDYRHYELGDNPRHIDWGVYARTEKLYIKQFQEEQDLSVLVLLDGSASMGPELTSKKWQLARNLALAFSYTALLQQDNVTMAVPGQRIQRGITGGKAVHLVSALLSECSPTPLEDFAHTALSSISAVRFPGVAIFISDFLFPFVDCQRIVNALRAKNLDICCIQVLGESDLDPLGGQESARVRDVETGEELELRLSPEELRSYQTSLVEHRDQVRNFLRGARIPFVSVLAQGKEHDEIIDTLRASGFVG